jgi:hypothetical protein
MGHGANIRSSYLSRPFYLSAVIYVNDTDLLHWPEFLGITREELIAHVQRATMDYGWLAQASGGILKENKCSVYFLAYKYIRGHAKMMTLWDLPPPGVEIIDDKGHAYPTHICIPQLDGPNMSIETHDVTIASKMLGVHFSLASNSSTIL